MLLSSLVPFSLAAVCVRVCVCVCVCVRCFSCASPLNGAGNGIRQKVNELLFAVLLVFGPKGEDYHHCKSIFFVFKSCIFFFLFFLFCSSQSAGQLLQANEPCNIHLVPHCCFGAAGCQPFLLIVLASCAEASGSKKKIKNWKKQAECLAKDVVYLSDKPGSCTNVTTPWQ